MIVSCKYIYSAWSLSGNTLLPDHWSCNTFLISSERDRGHRPCPNLGIFLRKMCWRFSCWIFFYFLFLWRVSVSDKLGVGVTRYLWYPHRAFSGCGFCKVSMIAFSLLNYFYKCLLLPRNYIRYYRIYPIVLTNFPYEKNWLSYIYFFLK